MQHHRIDPEEHPPKNGESWWIIHPNKSSCEFKVPPGAVAICTETFSPFKKDDASPVISVDYHNGWITLRGNEDYYDMPFYFFARHFDAEAFVCGRATPEEIENAKPFDYKPTISSSFTDGIEGRTEGDR